MTQRSSNCETNCLCHYLQGADFVEFDVQLTKDEIPVIYHDLKVLLTYRKVTHKIISIIYLYRFCHQGPKSLKIFTHPACQTVS